MLLNYFEHHINLELDQTQVPIVFKKETPDRDAVIDMGNAMLEAFHEGVNLTGFEILEIERPLSARLYTDEGQPTDLKLIGVLDLVLAMIMFIGLPAPASLVGRKRCLALEPERHTGIFQRPGAESQSPMLSFWRVEI